MKVFLLLAVVIAGAFSEEFDIIAPGEFTADDLLAGNNRIGSGVAAKKGENLDYVYLTVQFIQKTQNCGGVLVDKQWVATSGRCVYE
jgi:secreted trypsin-like serine protease